MTDEELVNSFLNGDKDAFETLLSRYQRPLYYMIKAMVLDAEEAKDITQDTFIKAFHSISGLKKKDRFKSWLFMIGANYSRDFLRKKRNNVPVETLDRAAESDSTDEKMAQKDLSNKVKEAMGCLPPRQKEVFQLRMLNDMSFKEISRTLDIKQETARANFHFALKGLRDILSKRGINHGM